MFKDHLIFPQRSISCLEKNMAPESNHIPMFEGSDRKENVTVTTEEKVETLSNIRQVKIGKPPRHCASSTQLASAAELVSLSCSLSVYSISNSFLHLWC